MDPWWQQYYYRMMFGPTHSYKPVLKPGSVQYDVMLNSVPDYTSDPAAPSQIGMQKFGTPYNPFAKYLGYGLFGGASKSRKRREAPEYEPRYYSPPHPQPYNPQPRPYYKPQPLPYGGYAPPPYQPQYYQPPNYRPYYPPTSGMGMGGMDTMTLAMLNNRQTNGDGGLFGGDNNLLPLMMMSGGMGGNKPMGGMLPLMMMGQQGKSRRNMFNMWAANGDPMNYLYLNQFQCGGIYADC